MDIKSKLITEIAEYYSTKLLQHGATPQGVDWNGEEGQNIRFIQLSKIINYTETYSINDLGCGYGALFDFLKNYSESFSYYGFDVSKDMISAAKIRYKEYNQAKFVLDSKPDIISDYGISSGIFNVRQGRTDSEWYEYIEDTLDILNSSSKIGFSCNFLTSYSDIEKKRDYLYYADPCKIFDLCKNKYSKNVALLHDYGLYEFTILVRK